MNFVNEAYRKYARLRAAGPKSLYLPTPDRQIHRFLSVPRSSDAESVQRWNINHEERA